MHWHMVDKSYKLQDGLYYIVQSSALKKRNLLRWKSHRLLTNGISLDMYKPNATEGHYITLQCLWVVYCSTFTFSPRYANSKLQQNYIQKFIDGSRTIVPRSLGISEPWKFNLCEYALYSKPGNLDLTNLKHYYTTQLFGKFQWILS